MSIDDADAGKYFGVDGPKIKCCKLRIIKISAEDTSVQILPVSASLKLTVAKHDFELNIYAKILSSAEPYTLSTKSG